jgi:hypothetical protein
MLFFGARPAYHPRRLIGKEYMHHINHQVCMNLPVVLNKKGNRVRVYIRAV